MIRGGILNSRARCARQAAPALARALAGAAVAAVGGAAVLAAAAAGPALAAQHPGGTAASHTRAGATGQHMVTGQHIVTGRTSFGATWTHIAAGDLHTCGIRTDSTLWCWGYNFYGELGIGNHANQDRPRQVTAPAAGGWGSVTADGAHTCATRTGGTLWCWGDNGYGDLGIGNQTPQDQPRQVTAPATGGWTSVTAGDYHTCATRTGGTLWCWGWNGHGELGIGSHAAQNRPRQVTAPAAGGWASVTANYVHTCATRTDGTMWCWGYNNLGQLGIGNRTDQDRPQQVTTLGAGGWASVTAGVYHTCATRSGGTLWCWGSNEYGQLGLGSHTGQDQPR